MFDQVSAQLRAASPEGLKPAQLTELSRRIAMVGRLTAGVAHEMKNPLNAMTIHLELLKQKLAAGKPANTHVEIIAHEIRRLDERIQGFLKFVRPEEVTFAPVAVSPLIASVLDAVNPEAQLAGVAIQRACQDGTLLVEGDAAKLREVFLNLAQNAIQAMPRGGRLAISCSSMPNRRVRVRVEDTGVGIAPENLPKIFELYYTTKESGTGVGLSMVYRTIQIHNGEIDVESTVGVGTTFIVVLPASAKSAAARANCGAPKADYNDENGCGARRTARAAHSNPRRLRCEGPGAYRGGIAAPGAATAATTPRRGLCRTGAASRHARCRSRRAGQTAGAPRSHGTTARADRVAAGAG